MSFRRWRSCSSSKLSAKSRAHIFYSCISKVFIHCCFLWFHTFTMPSTLADANWRPELSHATFTRAELWPCNVVIHLPSDRVHIFKVLSPQAETKSYSVGANWISHTPFLCPLKVVFSCKLPASQILIVLSYDDVAISLSFGEILTAFIYFWCAIMVISADFILTNLSAFSGIFQTLRVLSWLTEAKNWDFFGAKHTPDIFSLCPSNEARQTIFY